MRLPGLAEQRAAREQLSRARLFPPLLESSRDHLLDRGARHDDHAVDVGDDEVAAGDEVLLFGPGDQGEPTAQDWADLLGTINYEIVTRIGARVPRTCVGGRA